MSRKILSIALMAIVLLIVMVPVALAETTPPVAIPEPGSLLMLGTGVAGLAGYVGLRWRSRK